MCELVYLIQSYTIDTLQFEFYCDLVLYKIQIIILRNIATYQTECQTYSYIVILQIMVVIIQWGSVDNMNTWMTQN